MKPETIATAIEALEECNSYLDPEWNDDDKEREARINAALADLRAWQEQSAGQPAMPDEVREIIITVLEDERDRHIINGGKAEHRKEIEAALRYIDGQPGTPTSAPAMPDWSQAPEWAQWWAVDANGAGWWYEYKPGESKDDWFTGRGNRMRSATPFVDWRATLRQRPDAASPGE